MLKTPSKYKLIINDNRSALLEYLNFEECTYETVDVNSAETDLKNGIFIIDTTEAEAKTIHASIPTNIINEVNRHNVSILFYVPGITNIYEYMEVLMTTMVNNGIDIGNCFVVSNTYIPAIAGNLPNYIFFPKEEIDAKMRYMNMLIPYHNYDVRDSIYRCVPTKDTTHGRAFFAALNYYSMLDHGYTAYSMPLDPNITMHESPEYGWADTWDEMPIMIDTLEIKLPLVPNFTENETVYSYIESYFNLVIHDDFSVTNITLNSDVFASIAHMQMFMVLASPYTLEAYRSLGYMTFSHIINESYDETLNAQTRLSLLFKRVYDLTYTHDNMLAKITNASLDVLKFNKELLMSPKKHKLHNMLHACTVKQKETINI